MGSKAKENRVKISVTVAPGLVRAMDAFLGEHPESDRSKVVDEAITLWYVKQQEHAMEEELTAPRSPTELEEMAAWRQVQGAAARRMFGRRA